MEHYGKLAGGEASGAAITHIKTEAQPTYKVWRGTAKAQETLKFSSDCSGFQNPDQWTVSDNTGTSNMNNYLEDMNNEMFASLFRIPTPEVKGEFIMEKMQAIVRAYLEENELVEDFMGFVETYDAEARLAKRKAELLGEDPEEEEE